MKRKYLLFLLLVLSLIPLLDLFNLGLPITHDGQDHVVRIANFYKNLAEGNLIPRWGANLNWGYGHPILMFLYPLPSYIASLFHFLGFSFVDSTKIIFGLSFALSGIFMFLWIKEIWGEMAGFAAGLLYMFAPYRFVDLYVRGAIGECWAFVWPPLILYFLLKLSKGYSYRYIAGGSFSLAALILSHNALSLMFLPIIFGYMVYLVCLSKKKLLFTPYHYIGAGFTILLGFGLSAFFWFPSFFEGKYTLRDIVTKDNVTGFENFTRLVWSPWNYGGTGSFSVQVGIIQWLVIIFSPLLVFLLWRKKAKIWIFLLFLYFSFWLAILFITPVSKGIYLSTPFLKNFQFAWRFLSLAIFPPAVFMGALIYLLPQRLKAFTICCLLFVTLLLNRDYWHAQRFLIKPESFYTGIYPGTTDTGESSPRWSVRFMEYPAKTHLEVIEGQATIEELKRTSTGHQYQIVVSKKARLRENTLYFPGWNVLVDGRLTTIEFQDPQNRGLMTFFVNSGRHIVSVQFKETKLRLFADAVSIASLISLLFYSILKKKLWSLFR